MSNKYWTDKRNGIDDANVEELNIAFDAIAQDIQDKGTSIKANNDSVFYSLKLIGQAKNTDGTYRYTFDNSEKKLNFTDSDSEHYYQGDRAYQLIVNNNDTFYRIILTGLDENENTVVATLDEEWFIDLGALLNVTPDTEHYIIAKNNIGIPFGNYAIESDDVSFNAAVGGMTYHDGATAIGLGSSALAHSTFVSGEGGIATKRRGSVIGGEGNASFGYGGTSMGVYTTANNCASLATGQYGIAQGWDSSNFGQAAGYYNIYNENGELKTFEEVFEDFHDTEKRKKMSIAYAQSSIVGGNNNVAGGIGSTVLGLTNVSTPEASWSLTLGGGNVNRVPDSLVLGTYVDNKDALINVSGKFKVLPTGVVSAPSYNGEGNALIATPTVVNEEYRLHAMEEIAFDDLYAYDASNLVTNTDNGTTVKNVLNYTDKNTYWHSKFRMKDGAPYPDPALAEDFQYVITFNNLSIDGYYNDEKDIPSIVVRFYPRQENGNLDTKTWWKRTKVKATMKAPDRKTYEFENEFNLSADDFVIDTETDSYYYDFIIDTSALPSSPVGSFQISKVEIIIYETANANKEYPYGTYACAQGLRIGTVKTMKLKKKPLTTDNTLGTVSGLVKGLKDCAYWGIDDINTIVKSSLETPKEEIELNTVAPLSEYAPISRISSQGIYTTDRNDFVISTYYGYQSGGSGIKLPSDGYGNIVLASDGIGTTNQSGKNSVQLIRYLSMGEDDEKWTKYNKLLADNNATDIPDLILALSEKIELLEAKLEAKLNQE